MFYALKKPWEEKQLYKDAVTWTRTFPSHKVSFDFVCGTGRVDGVYPRAIMIEDNIDYLAFKLRFGKLLF